MQRQLSIRHNKLLRIYDKVLEHKVIYIYIYIEGVKQMLLSQVTWDGYVCQKKEKQQYISVGTVRMFPEPRANH